MCFCAFTIMLIGCWSSNPSLCYICRQVQEFSAGVSSKMLLTDEFFAISGITPEDPRVSHNNSNNFAARGLNIGFTAQKHAMTHTRLYRIEFMATWPSMVNRVKV
jgi:hypothetical protein